MKIVHMAAATAMMALLAGCAGTISQPTALVALSAEQQASIHIGNITADADKGVDMTTADYQTIIEHVRNYVQEGSPGVIVDPATDGAVAMKIHFTRFDKGSAFARAMLIGLGQIHIDAIVTLVKADGTSVGEYKVRKTFALGGIVGAVTRIEDVEIGFSKSVAEVVKAKTAK